MAFLVVVAVETWLTKLEESFSVYRGYIGFKV